VRSGAPFPASTTPRCLSRQPKSQSRNAALVAKAVRIIQELGVKIATASEARNLLGLQALA
jgi:uncharacterized protein (DUF849 family)